MALLAISATVLYGCGGESPTATVAAPQSTTGTGSSGSGGPNQPNDPAAINFMQQSSRAMQQLKSAHLTLQIEGGLTPSSGEGDISLPSSVRITMTDTAGMTERIAIGPNLYTKAPGSDAYVVSPSYPFLLKIASVLSNMDAYTQNAQGATLVGSEQLGPAQVKHVSFYYDPEKVTASYYQAQGVPTPVPTPGAATLAKGEMWFDAGSYYVRQYKSELPPSPATGNMTQTTTITLTNLNNPVTPPIEQPSNVTQTTPTP
jgi:hypothetical protein